MGVLTYVSMPVILIGGLTMKNLNDIKKDIHIINPSINDKLLDLLYEYVMLRYGEYLEKRNQGKYCYLFSFSSI